MPHRTDQPAKYEPWRQSFLAQSGERLPLTMAELEALLVTPLPRTARTSRTWWSNTWGSRQAQAWLMAGWRVERVDLYARTVTFVRPPGRAAAGPAGPLRLRRGPFVHEARCCRAGGGGPRNTSRCGSICSPSRPRW